MVVQDSRSPRDGRFIEHIGAFRPTHGDATLVVDRSRLEYWLSAGAQMSDSVRNRLKLKVREWQAAGGSATPVADKPASKPPKAKASAKNAKTKEKEA
jgi:small subunit ribosomal protein S16